MATTDDYQEEDAKMVIIPLVRSNDREEFGFLKTENRINVLLSRAQCGHCLFGDVETYTPANMWKTICFHTAHRGHLSARESYKTTYKRPIDGRKQSISTIFRLE